MLFWHVKIAHPCAVFVAAEGAIGAAGFADDLGAAGGVFGMGDFHHHVVGLAVADKVGALQQNAAGGEVQHFGGYDLARRDLDSSAPDYVDSGMCAGVTHGASSKAIVQTSMLQLKGWIG